MEKLKERQDDINKLNQAIKKAKRQAPSREDYLALQKENTAFVIMFLQKTISLSDFRQVTAHLAKRNGIILFETINDFQETLLLILPANAVQEAVRHEEKHLNTALNAGFTAKLGISFVKDKKQSVFRKAFTQIDIPADYDEELARKNLLHVITAPGVDMSSSDLTMAVSDCSLGQ